MDDSEGIEHNYNLVLTENLSDLDLELFCFLNDHPPAKGGLGKAGHFRRFVEKVWGPSSNMPISWNPWMEKMLEEACQHKYLGIIGCGNSSKTTFAALWGLVNWAASRFATKVLVTSTSLKESRKRIWGCLVELYLAARIFPGKLVDSMGIIRSRDSDEEVASDRSGIELIPGEKRKEREAIGKLIGIKAPRIILICDELPELSEALISASLSNLALNPGFQLMALGNFASIYDPLGVFVRPKIGYGAITTEDIEWDTELGKCIRFDGLKSPNILSGRDEWPHIYSSKDLKNHRQTLGEHTALFWRMCRSFPCPEGEEGTIYTEADMTRGNVHGSVTWMNEYTRAAAIDPGFTSDGDKSVMITACYGLSNSGVWTICFEHLFILRENVELGDQPRNFQIVRQFVQKCKDLGIRPENTAYDATSGGGILFGEILAEQWSSQCLGVCFGGNPSDQTISPTDPRKANEIYANRVTELWYGGLDFVRSGQIKGLHDEVAVQWRSRRCVTVKTGTVKTRVEPKRDMKLRTGHSPDEGDAGVMIIALCRERLGARPGGGELNSRPFEKNWVETSKYWDSVNTELFAEAYDADY